MLVGPRQKLWEVSVPEAGNMAPGAAQSGAQPGVFNDPYRAYNFKLVIQGVTEGHFTACSGLGIKVQVIKYREGGTHQGVHCIPGPVEPAAVRLRYGPTPSPEPSYLVTGAV